MTAGEISGGVHILDGRFFVGKDTGVISTGLVRGRSSCSRRHQRRDVVNGFATVDTENEKYKEDAVAIPMREVRRPPSVNLTPIEFPQTW